MSYYTLGIICGMMLVIAVFLLTNKKEKCKFDERQAVNRGKGYAIAFYCMVGGILIYILLKEIDVQLPVTDTLLLLIMIMLTLTIHVVYCIFKDAYFSINEKMKDVYWRFGILGGFNLFYGIKTMITGEAFDNGIMNVNSLNLFCGIMFVIMFIALLMKKVFLNKDEEE